MKTIEKPWGKEVWFAEVPDAYLGKFLHVSAGQKLSVQYHENKTETMICISGYAVLHRYSEELHPILSITMKEDESYTIYPEEIHSVEAITDCVILEVSTYYPDDIVRLRDRYGRL